MPPYLYFMQLPALIAATRVTQVSPVRRRYAVENTLPEFFGYPVTLEELRMAPYTREALFLWVDTRP